MIYIFETELENSKSIFYSLKKIYGLNLYQAKLICKKLGFSPNFKTSNLNSEQITRLIKLIENTDVKITNELRKDQVFALKNLIDIKCYSGLRRIRGLPVRGQRTHTNSKTAKKRLKNKYILDEINL